MACGFVKLRRGLLEHLPIFAGNLPALLVFVWAMLTRDHRTGEFSCDRRDIANQTGLSQWQVKRALDWLQHGRGCSCKACADLSPWDRPQYLRIVRPAARSRPPRYLILRDPSLDDFHALPPAPGVLELFPKRKEA